MADPRQRERVEGMSDETINGGGEMGEYYRFKHTRRASLVHAGTTRECKEMPGYIASDPRWRSVVVTSLCGRISERFVWAGGSLSDEVSCPSCRSRLARAKV